jgi:arsenite-transporting ATPase
VSAVVRFLADLPRFVFFTGKGGVGKTSLACATAVHLADAGRRVLLVSTDPASNVGQVFGLTIGARVTPVPGVAGLEAIEIDPQQAATAYRERIVGPVRDLLPAAEIASITEQLSGSCTTEVASFNEFTGLLADDTRSRLRPRRLRHRADRAHDPPAAAAGRMDRVPRRRQGRRVVPGTDGRAGPGPVDLCHRPRSSGRPAWTRLVLVARAQASSLAEAARTATELAQIGITDQRPGRQRVLPPDVLATGSPLRSTSANPAPSLTLPPALAGMPCTHVPLRADTIVGVAAVRRLLADRCGAGRDARAGSGRGRGCWVPDLGLPALQVRCTPTVLPGLDRLVDELARQDHGLVMCMGKGGVGKTTVAAAIAVALADRGHAVHLTTTDPAGHLHEATTRPRSWQATGGRRSSRLGVDTVSRIDPHAATAAYREKVMADQGSRARRGGAGPVRRRSPVAVHRGGRGLPAVLAPGARIAAQSSSWTPHRRATRCCSWTRPGPTTATWCGRWGRARHTRRR